MAINKCDVPNDGHEATIHYKARKAALLDLLAKISTEMLSTGSQISGEILNQIDELDEILER